MIFPDVFTVIVAGNTSGIAVPDGLS